VTWSFILDHRRPAVDLELAQVSQTGLFLCDAANGTHRTPQTVPLARGANRPSSPAWRTFLLVSPSYLLLQYQRRYVRPPVQCRDGFTRTGSDHNWQINAVEADDLCASSTLNCNDTKSGARPLDVCRRKVSPVLRQHASGGCEILRCRAFDDHLLVLHVVDRDVSRIGRRRSCCTDNKPGDHFRTRLSKSSHRHSPTGARNRRDDLRWSTVI
jgi:hypothetical protein